MRFMTFMRLNCKLEDQDLKKNENLANDVDKRIKQIKLVVGTKKN
jgi:hypothetical protein